MNSGLAYQLSLINVKEHERCKELLSGLPVRTTSEALSHSTDIAP